MEASHSLLRTTRPGESDHKVYLVLEGSDLRESLVEINQDFIKKYPLQNTKLLILMGSNANEGVRRVISLLSAAGKGLPSMVSITAVSTGEFD